MVKLQATCAIVFLMYPTHTGDSPEDIGIEIVFTSPDAKGELHIQGVFEMELTKVEGSLATFEAAVLPEHTGMYQVGKRIFPKNPRLPHRQDFPLVKWL